jgi:crotonobetainyl-CoA:carnitine CoA-transferase CaiB-like acyl-CoA transferase
LTNYYRSSDGRFLFLVMMESDRYWQDFCEHIDRPDLIDDPRFADASARARNTRECIMVLDDVFAERTMNEWRERLSGMDAPWASVQTALEVHDDPQVVANDYLRDVTSPNGKFRLVATPVQFDESVGELTCAPESGEHTEEVLLELGLEWDEILAHKAANDIR